MSQGNKLEQMIWNQKKGKMCELQNEFSRIFTLLHKNKASRDMSCNLFYLSVLFCFVSCFSEISPFSSNDGI